VIFRASAAAVALILVFLGTVNAQAPAWAIDYPTWSDVAAARNSEAATKAKIAEITALIAGLQAEVDRTQAEAQAKGELFQAADQKFQEQALKADELQAQADEAQKLAEESIARAGEMVAQLYRGGNGDVTMTLLVNAADADDLLYSFGMADKFTEQSATVYETALQDQKSAQSMTDQANVAKEIREELRLEAEAALQVAQAAADAAAVALEAQQQYQNQLNAQLVVLSERRAATEADYAKGVAVRAAAAAAALAAGQITADGWAKPASGWISSGFGGRTGSSGYNFHLGTDIATSCGNPIYAAKAGVVTYSGWNGVYGNYIQIDHGGGVSTAYGHIQNGGLLVRNGAYVDAGQNIAKVGATGGATGCHVHFGVLLNGVVTNPVPYMRDRGITLG
jgi:murein DD-endopeptidase MepM/ murein hydrolase activator NlpD